MGILMAQKAHQPMDIATLRNIFRCYRDHYLKSCPYQSLDSLDDFMTQLFESIADPSAFSAAEMWNILGTLIHRMRLMNAGTAWVKKLGLTFPPCNSVEIMTRLFALPQLRRGLVKDMSQVITRLRIFDEPQPGEGERYLKPQLYVALAAENEGWTAERLEDKLVALLGPTPVGSDAAADFCHLRGVRHSFDLRLDVIELAARVPQDDQLLFDATVQAAWMMVGYA